MSSHQSHTIDPYNSPIIHEPIYLQKVRFISDKFLFNNVSNVNIMTAVPTVPPGGISGVGIKTDNPRYDLDVIGGIITTGCVGIGYSMPVSLLSVCGGATIGATYSNTVAPPNSLIVSGSVGVNTSAPASRFSVCGNVAIGSGYSNIAAPIDGMVVLGNVGIGTTNAKAKFTVNGSVSIGSSYVSVTPPRDCLIVSSNVGIGTSVPFSKLSISNGGIAVGSNYMSVVAPDSSIIVSSNIGIGVTNPQSRLVVNGNAVVGSAFVATSVPADSLAVSGNIGVGTATPKSKIAVIGGGVSVGYSNATAPNDMIIVSGNIGVGTSMPGSTLSVYGGFALGTTFSAQTASPNVAIIEGSLGVGTNAPTSKLTVSGGATIGSAFATELAPSDGLAVVGRVGIGVPSPNAQLSVSGGATFGTAFTSFNSPSDGVIIVGNVGIGTTSPASKLSVSGGVAIGSNYCSSNAPIDGLIVVGNVGIGTNVPQAKMSISGNTTIGTPYANVAAPIDGLIVSGSVGVGNSTPGAKLSINGGIAVGNAYGTTAAPVDGMIVVGNVGIGTTLPSSNLHVEGHMLTTGDARVIGTLTTGNLAVIGELATLQSYTYESSNLVIDNRRGFGPALKVTQSGFGEQYPIADFYDIELSTELPAFRIADGGNVGIKTTVPNFDFDVFGNVGISGMLLVDAAANVTACNIQTYHDVTSLNNIIALGYYYGTIGTVDQPLIQHMPGVLSIGSNNDAQITGTLMTNVQSNLLYMGLTNSCNIGIGTTTTMLGAKLDVYGNVAVGGRLLVDSNINITASNITAYQRYYGTIATSNQPYLQNLGGVLTIGSNNDAQITGILMSPMQSNILYMGLRSNIGIGTMSPSANSKLDVFGNIAIGGKLTIDSNTNVYTSNLTVFSGISGLITTSNQPYITDLSNVTYVGLSNAALVGKVMTPNQPYIQYLTATNVGINTTVTTGTLTVNGSISIGNKIVIDDSANVVTNNIQVTGGIEGIILTPNQSNIRTLSNVDIVGYTNTQVYGSVINSIQPYIQTLGYGNPILGIPSQNIGIGVLSPTAKLDVDGNIAISGSEFVTAQKDIYVRDVYASGTLHGAVVIDSLANTRYLPDVISIGSASTSVGIGTTAASSNAKVDICGGNIALNGHIIFDTNSNVYCSNVYSYGTVKANVLEINKIYGELQTAEQSKITSLGILTTLQVGQVTRTADITVYGKGTFSDAVECSKLKANTDFTMTTFDVNGARVMDMYASSNMYLYTSNTSPSLLVKQASTGHIADFYDLDKSSTVPVLRVAKGGKIGIGSSVPTQALDIGTGNISCGYIYASGASFAGPLFSGNVYGISGGFSNLTVTSNISASNAMFSNMSSMQSVMSNITGTSATLSNVTIQGVLTVNGSLVTNGGAGGGYVPTTSVDTAFNNNTSHVPASSLLYSLASNIANNQYVFSCTSSYSDPSPGSGKYNIQCTASGIAFSYNWSLSNLGTSTVIATASGTSPYTFTNVVLTPGTVNLAAIATTGGSGAGSSAVSPTLTFTALGQETVGTPYVSLSNIATVSGTGTIDGVVYYTSGATLTCPVNSLSFSNLIKVNPYPANNTFLTIGSSTYGWANVFTSSPTNENLVKNTIALTNVPLSTSAMILTVRNAVGSSSITKTFAYTSSLSQPTLANTNATISNVTRTYANGTSLGTTDVLYAPDIGRFATSLNNIFGSYDFAPTQTISTALRSILYLSITPVTGSPIITFNVTHGSTVDDIYVQWTDISSTYYQASLSLFAGGCGNGTQSGSTWYITRPSSLNQSTVSSVLLYIVYNSSVTTAPKPIIS